MDYEIAQIRETFLEYPSYTPTLCYIVVSKRVSTRIFSNRLENPLPGTVIEAGCVRPGWYDFYLISQSVRQGTVSPCHYHVIYDTTHIDPDRIQQLTFKLCHLYYNWPGTIRVPAPCHYAHKIAFLVGQSIHTDVARDLANTLYFL